MLMTHSANSKVLLIGHSLGSVIANDSLCKMPQTDKLVDMFLSLGSPLGLHYTQERLLGFSKTDFEAFPANIKQWQNVSANGDLVSVDMTLADDFSLMTKHQRVDSIVDHHKKVYCWYKNPQGYNFHSSYGYFLEPTVSSIISRWWQQD